MVLKKPKKENYKSIKRELDSLLCEICFARDKHRCIRCGRTDALAPSHIYPKGKYKRMRWEINNVKTLCYSCHIHFWHKNPIEAHEWLETAIPKERLDKLKLQAMYVDKSPIDYKLIKIYLKNELKKYVQ